MGWEDRLPWTSDPGQTPVNMWITATWTTSCPKSVSDERLDQRMPSNTREHNSCRTITKLRDSSAESHFSLQFRQLKIQTKLWVFTLKHFLQRRETTAYIMFPLGMSSHVHTSGRTYTSQSPTSTAHWPLLSGSRWTWLPENGGRKSLSDSATGSDNSSVSRFSLSNKNQPRGGKPRKPLWTARGPF